jgi:hypothetical protein
LRHVGLTNRSSRDRFAASLVALSCSTPLGRCASRLNSGVSLLWSIFAVMSKHPAIEAALKLIFQGINDLKSEFPNRAFTIDGRLVGDIGEVIAALAYDVIVDDTSQATHDGVTSDGRRVQVKATFQNSLTFKTTPDYYLGFKLNTDGSFEEIYNGPGQPIFERYETRKGIGTSLLSFPISELKKLSEKVQPHDRISRREG